MKIIPSILVKTTKEFEEQVNNLSPYFPRFQIDICDGIFVPNKTLQIQEINVIQQPHYAKATRGKQSNTVTKNKTFDFHLMVKDYQKEIDRLEKIKNIFKINNIFIHLKVLDTKYLILNTYFYSFGLVLDPEDSVEKLQVRFPDLNKIPAIQIMTIHPGFQGQKLIPETLKKIEQLRLKKYKNEIYLDGGINDKTLPLVLKLKYKPDFLCIGSYLTKVEKDQTIGDFLIKLENH